MGKLGKVSTIYGYQVKVDCDEHLNGKSFAFAKWGSIGDSVAAPLVIYFAIHYELILLEEGLEVEGKVSVCCIRIYKRYLKSREEILL